MYDTGKKISIAHKDVEDSYSMNKGDLLDGIKNIINEKGSITLESLTRTLWVNGIQNKFQNRYLFEMCMAKAIDELKKGNEIEEEDWVYKRK